MAASRVDTVLEVKDHIAAYVALLSGQFEDEINRLQKLKAELEERLEQAGVLNNMEQIKADQDRYVTKKQQEAADAIAAIRIHQEAIAVEQTEVLTKQKLLNLERQAFQEEKNKFDIEVTQVRSVTEQALKEAKATLKDAQSKLNDVLAREEAVTMREVDVQRKLEVLKSL